MAVESSTLSRDFWRFWAGQTVSNLGNSVTLFALPLLMFKLTGSALNLALVTTAQFLPYLLFGLILGAWVDRVDRRRLMIAADIARAAVIASIPLLAAADALEAWWIYAVAFVTATLSISFDAAQFAAIPSLVATDDLVTANGRIQASFSVATIVGPLLAGALVVVAPVETVLAIDAGSFLASALSLAFIRTSFNSERTEGESVSTIWRDIVEGLRYVLGHPVLRGISAMMALVNFVGTTVFAQLVLFAHERLDAGDSRVGFLFAAQGLGVVALSLGAGPLRKRWSFSIVALGALMLDGVLIILLALTSSYWLAVPIVALNAGAGTLFNINTGSLRQAIVPNHLLGRVITVAGVLAFMAIPLGTLLGGWAIERTDNVALVYAVIGTLITLIAVSFAFTPVGRAERYLRPKKSAVAPVSCGLREDGA